MGKIKILYVIDNRSFRGGERVFAQLATGLDRERFEPVVAALPSDPFADRLRAHEIRLYPVDMRSRYKVRALWQLLRIIQSERIDVIHTQGAGGDFFGRLAGALARRPFIVSAMAILVDDSQINRFKKRLSTATDRLSERFVDRFTTVSESLRQRLIREHNLDPCRVYTIHNGIAIDRWDSSITTPGQFRQELGIPANVHLVGGIGSLVWQKGFEYFIQAAARISEMEPLSRFVIVGEGHLRPELERQARALGLEEKLIFTGFRQDVRIVFADLDVFVLSSLLEGLPMVLLEAMAMQCPTVATNIDGIPEVLTHGETGWLVPPRDISALTNGIVTLLRDQDLTRQLGEQARRHVAQYFSVREMVRKNEQLYIELMDGKIST